MLARLLLCALLLALWWDAHAEEQAFTNRATELKERGGADARTLATLPENTAVKVLARSGGWTRVETGGQSGWVRVFHLRFPATVDSATASSSASPLSGLTSALGFGRERERQANVASTGVRGLTPEDLKNASPDPAALAKLQSFRADKPSAERFAREAHLAAVPVEYVEPAAGSSSKGGGR